MTNIKILLLAIAVCFSASPEVTRHVSEDLSRQVKKFEELFIWKVSDELKLTQKEEAIAAEVIRDTNKKKRQSNADLEYLYKKLNEETTDQKRKAVLNKIKAVHRAQLNMAIDELDRLSKGLGLKRLGQYLEIKRDLSEKIKNVWNQNEKKGDKVLPPPKVIEEK